MYEIPKNINLEEVGCPNKCVAESDLILSGNDLLHSLPGVFHIYRCKSCGLERTSPRPTSESMGYYYPESYGPYDDKPFSPIKSDGFKGKIIKLLGLESRKLPSITPNRMLELGCSSGGYMEYARSLGWDVHGIEFAEKAARLASNKGFNVHVGSVESAVFDPEQFDVIVAWMVLEHVHDPELVLKKCLSWVKKDGYLIFLVPDRNSISRRIFGRLSHDNHLPNHLYHYNSKSLKILLNNFGWDIIKVKHQRNCNTFLKSIENWCKVQNNLRLLKYVKYFNNSDKTRFIRLMLGIAFGLIKQSGRIEVWAKPIINDE
jgi:SAM-dependent methyltransferase